MAKDALSYGIGRQRAIARRSVHGLGLKPQMLVDCSTVHHGSVAVAGHLVDEHRRARQEAA